MGGGSGLSSPNRKPCTFLARLHPALMRILPRFILCYSLVALVAAKAADPEPRWWKGNLHTHSLWSDGDDYPEMIADWYKSHGYQFLAMTDHNRLSEGERWVDTGGEKSKAGGVALEKYLARFGPSWVERREAMGKPQVRLKPL